MISIRHSVGKVARGCSVMAYMVTRFGVLGVYVAGRSKEKRPVAPRQAS
jgi:hypothetical protein